MSKLMGYNSRSSKMLLMTKENLCELLEECLHNMERECDLVGESEKVKKV